VGEFDWYELLLRGWDHLLAESTAWLSEAQATLADPALTVEEALQVRERAAQVMAKLAERKRLMAKILSDMEAVRIDRVSESPDLTGFLSL